MAADLEALLDQCGIERLVLLGTDPSGAEAVLAEPDAWARLTDHPGTPREQASRLIALLFRPTLAPEIDCEFGDLVAEARKRLSPTALRTQEVAMQAWHADEQEPPQASVFPPALRSAGVAVSLGQRESVGTLMFQ